MHVQHEQPPLAGTCKSLKFLRVFSHLFCLEKRRGTKVGTVFASLCAFTLEDVLRMGALQPCRAYLLQVLDVHLQKRVCQAFVKQLEAG